MTKEEKEKLLLRIGEARFCIQIKENLTPLDYKIDGVLADCAEKLWQTQPTNLLSYCSDDGRGFISFDEE